MYDDVQRCTTAYNIDMSRGERHKMPIDATSISSYPLTLQVVDACGEKIAESSCCDSVPDAITAVPSMHRPTPTGCLFNPFGTLSPQDLGQFCIENRTHYLKQLILQERSAKHTEMKICTKFFLFYPVLLCFPSAS